jgi:UDP-N-acetylglucosamine--N-acetylmuramyl-(pentapeptide) pyrophosphoryl-undecaprenol N-acetylglucosamine transferase
VILLSKTIVLTGGGTAGHVTVNLALIPKLLAEGWDVHYVGSDGIEKQLVSELPAVKFHTIAAGKLRRYWDWKNLKDPLLVMKGVMQSYRLMRKLKPAVLFSKGGFVSVPVVAGAWMCRVPVILHESDITPGLANRLCIPMACKVFTTFPETQEALPGGKAEYIGAVVRREILNGNAQRGRMLCDFVSTRPVVLVMGGSLGARRINEAVRAGLDQLLLRYQIVHICGKGNLDSSLHRRGYKQFEFVSKELPDLMAMADLVVSRAGSNSIYEFHALRKPMLLIPLSRSASRGDQILNAASFERSGYARVLQDEQLTGETLLEQLQQLEKEKETLKANMAKRGGGDPLLQIMDALTHYARRRG